MTQVTRHIQVEGGFNIRDLGGYPTADGRVTRSNRLIRAGNLHEITPAGQEMLLHHGLKTVIDLRDESELRNEPDVFAESNHVRYLHRPYALDTFDPTPEYNRLDEWYCHSLTIYQDNIRSIMITIAEAEPCVLYHCAVGKDRTGMVSGLVLSLVGVPVEVIAEDYEETTRHITHLVEKWRQWTLDRDGNMKNFERDIAADAAIMLATLQAVEKEYGGAADYLRGCGVTDAQLQRIKALLLD
jgi:protein-tyrosine phosphatase